MKLHPAWLVFLVAACGGDGGTGEGTSELTGAATYRDAETDLEGNAQEPAAPADERVKLTVVVEGQGTLPELDPQCALDPAGRFEAHYTSDIDLSDDGAYAALFGASTAQLLTPSGCEIPDLTVALITDVRVRGEIVATTQSCDAYCSAEARADAEASCGATSTAAECRTEAEATGKLSCMAECTPDQTLIVAETSLAASLFGELDADALRAAAFGDFEANLEFDHLEN